MPWLSAEAFTNLVYSMILLVVWVAGILTLHDRLRSPYAEILNVLLSLAVGATLVLLWR